jgi:hypothetical protein
MRQPPAYTTWKITCQSPDDARALRQWLAPRIDLDRVWTDTVRTAPDGVEQVQAIPHRLGDYFAEIRALPDVQSPPESFRLVFRRRPDAGRFWKDLMVNVLGAIRAGGRAASVEFDSKGDTAPTAPGLVIGPEPKVVG